MAGILRGDIFWADLNPTGAKGRPGLRPVLVISQDVFNRHSGTVIALALTGRPPKAGFPLTLEVAGARLPKRSWVKIGQVRTLPAERLTRKLGEISPLQVEQVVDGLKEIIGG
jgi:mRNA interferase MazF